MQECGQFPSQGIAMNAKLNLPVEEIVDEIGRERVDL